MHPFTVSSVDKVAESITITTSPNSPPHRSKLLSAWSLPVENDSTEHQILVESFRRSVRPFYWIARLYGLDLDDSCVTFSPARSLLSTVLQVAMLLGYAYTAFVTVGALAWSLQNQQSIFRCCDDFCMLWFAALAFVVHLAVFWKRDVLRQFFEGCIQLAARVQIKYGEDDSLQQRIRMESLFWSAVPWLGAVILLVLRLLANLYQCNKLYDPDGQCDLLQPMQCHMADNTTLRDRYKTWFYEFNYQTQYPFPNLTLLFREPPFGVWGNDQAPLQLDATWLARLDLLVPQLLLVPFYLLGAAIFVFGCRILSAVMGTLGSARLSSIGDADIRCFLGTHRDACRLISLLDAAFGIPILVWCTLEIGSATYVVRALNIHQPYIFNAHLTVNFLLHLTLFFGKALAADEINSQVLDSLSQLRDRVNDQLAINHLEAMSVKTDVSLYIQQLVVSPFDISGWNFFVLNRDLTLSVTGAVVTFTFVLYSA